VSNVKFTSLIEIGRDQTLTLPELNKIRIVREVYTYKQVTRNIPEVKSSEVKSSESLIQFRV
jgi:hypothetical protein